MPDKAIIISSALPPFHATSLCVFSVLCCHTDNVATIAGIAAAGGIASVFIASLFAGAVVSTKSKSN